MAYSWLARLGEAGRYPGFAGVEVIYPTQPEAGRMILLVVEEIERVGVYMGGFDGRICGKGMENTGSQLISTKPAGTP